MSAIRELAFFFALFFGAIIFDQHQFDNSGHCQAATQYAEKVCPNE